MLNDATREQIQERLIDEIAGKEERIMELEKSTAPIAPDKALGRLTRLDAMQDKSVREAALAQARESLVKLELALTRVFNREFGICITCGEGIPVERLVVLPGSVRCVECAAKFRTGERA